MLGDHPEDLASTTTGLDLESVMALQTDLTSDEELSTTIDLSDAQAIRKQLDGLENMYTEVLKLLGEILIRIKDSDVLIINPLQASVSLAGPLRTVM